MPECLICGNDHLDVDESCSRAADRRKVELTVRADQLRVAENERRRAEGAREERGAVVRWLREEGLRLGAHSDIWQLEHCVDRLADEIEAGEHRKEAPGV